MNRDPNNSRDRVSRIEEEFNLRKEQSNRIDKLERAKNKALAEQELNLKKTNAEKIAEQELRQAKFLADYSSKLAKAGLEKNVKEQQKALELLAKQENLEKLKAQTELHKQATEDAKAEIEARKELLKAIRDDVTLTTAEKKEAESKVMTDELKRAQQFEKLDKALTKLGDKLGELSGVMSKYADYQRAINVRVQGSVDPLTGIPKSFKSMESLLSDAIGVTPFVQTQKMMDNLTALVDQGILYNVEQRAFLSTISDNIAATFDAANSSLLQIVKLQQADSTAARLGLEAYMTQFLNRAFQDSQYLGTAGGSGLFDSVSSALLQASSLMEADQSLEFEYNVQKWLGALSSVGLSDSTVGSLASAIGAIGSGDIRSLSSDEGMQNLTVMAASRAGLDYSQLLIDGLDPESTNILLESIITYLQEIASQGNKVVRSQYADIFGINITDMTAALNLSVEEMRSISKDTLTYAGAMTELTSQFAYSTLAERLSTGERIKNIAENLKYGLAAGVAENPAMYALWQITDMIQQNTGGINIPYISALGSGVDLNTTVDNLMKLGLVGVSSLGLIGDIVQGFQNTADPSRMLQQLNIGDLSRRSRGRGLSDRVSPVTQSESLSVVSSGGGDIYEATLGAAQSGAQETLQTQAAEREAVVSLKEGTTVRSIIHADETDSISIINRIEDNVVSIYSILKRVVDGDGSIQVRLSPADNITGLN